MSTPPYPKREASQYKVYPRPRSGTTRIGAVVNLVFSSWNDFSQASVHSNLTSFLVRRVRGDASFAKSLRIACSSLLDPRNSRCRRHISGFPNPTQLQPSPDPLRSQFQTRLPKTLFLK